MKSDLYYQNSRRIGMLTFPLFIICAVFFMYVGWAYAWATWKMPWAIANPVLTIILACALWVGTTACVDHGPCPNRKVGTSLAVLVGITTWYSQWAAWLHFVSADGGLTTSWLDLLIHPEQVWNLSREVASRGAWSIFHFEVRGALLYAIWILEALLILVGAALGRMATGQPFSEKMNDWCQNHHGKFFFRHIADTAAFVKQLEEAPASFPTLLAELGQPEEENPANFSELTFLSCKGEDNVYVILSNITNTVVDGETEGKMDPFLMEFRITRQMMETVAGLVPAQFCEKA